MKKPKPAPPEPPKPVPLNARRLPFDAEAVLTLSPDLAQRLRALAGQVNAQGWPYSAEAIAHLLLSRAVAAAELAGPAELLNLTVFYDRKN